MNTNYIQPIENASTGSYTTIIDKKVICSMVCRYEYLRGNYT